MDVPLQVCESRDPKGLYKLAREGKIKGSICYISISSFCQLGSILCSCTVVCTLDLMN